MIQTPPATSPPSSPPVASEPTSRSAAGSKMEFETAVKIITPSSVEVPPPPPVEKESKRVAAEEDVEEEVGDTVEIDLR